MFVLSPALCDILRTCMARYSLFVLKVPLNTKQANKQTNDFYVYAALLTFVQLIHSFVDRS